MRLDYVCIIVSVFHPFSICWRKAKNVSEIVVHRLFLRVFAESFYCKRMDDRKGTDPEQSRRWRRMWVVFKCRSRRSVHDKIMRWERKEHLACRNKSENKEQKNANTAPTKSKWFSQVNFSCFMDSLICFSGNQEKRYWSSKIYRTGVTEPDRSC